MKNRIICFFTGLIIGACTVIFFNSLDRVAAFEIRQSSESMILGRLDVVAE
jgi:hypothetical protein